MKDVTESKELRVTCEKSSSLAAIFLNATEGYEKILGDQLRNEPTLFVPDTLDILNNVVQHKAAYPGSKSLVKYMIREDKKRSGHCRMTISTELKAYRTTVWQFQFPIGSQRLSKFILRHWDNGLIAYDRDQEVQSKDQCRVDKPMETKKRALTLNDLSPASLILGVGLALSTLCFFS